MRMNCFVALLSATATAMNLGEIASSVSMSDCELFAQLLTEKYGAAPTPFTAAETAAQSDLGATTVAASTAPHHSAATLAAFEIATSPQSLAQDDGGDDGGDDHDMDEEDEHKQNSAWGAMNNFFKACA